MSLRAKTAIIVIVALIAIAGFNYLIRIDPTQLAARGVGKDPHAHGRAHEHEEHEQHQPQEDPSRPIGPEDAPILIQACYMERGMLMEELRPMLKDVAQDYAGLVRVEFVDTTKPESREMIEQVAKGMINGLIINGEVTKATPGTAFGMSSFRGLASFDDWSVAELRLAIEHELAQKGVEFTSHVGEETETAMPIPPPVPEHSHGH